MRLARQLSGQLIKVDSALKLVPEGQPPRSLLLPLLHWSGSKNTGLLTFKSLAPPWHDSKALWRRGVVSPFLGASQGSVRAELQNPEKRFPSWSLQVERAKFKPCVHVPTSSPV